MKNVLLILLVLLTVNCTQNKKIVKVDPFPFLEIEGDLNENPLLLWQNKDIYMEAQYRMEKLVKIDNNLFEWDFTAEDVRVSKNLFDYIVAGWKSYNERLETGLYEIYKNECNLYFIRRKPIKSKE